MSCYLGGLKPSTYPQKKKDFKPLKELSYYQMKKKKYIYKSQDYFKEFSYFKKGFPCFLPFFYRGPCTQGWKETDFYDRDSLHVT